MFLVKAFWLTLLISIVCGFLFLGVAGIPTLQLPANKSINLLD